jgi:hypothetical protein
MLKSSLFRSRELAVSSHGLLATLNFGCFSLPTLLNAAFNFVHEWRAGFLFMAC